MAAGQKSGQLGKPARRRLGRYPAERSRPCQGGSLDASIQSLPEWQCRPHGWAYISRGPTALRIWKELDPYTRDVTAFHVQWQQAAETPIYLDGRPQPPDFAPYTWMGFSTAKWEGDILKITTTHIKEDYLRRNGIFVSDKATVTTYWSRHGDYLTWINIVHDPVYLTEPLIRSGEYRLTARRAVSCASMHADRRGNSRPAGCPRICPGKNPFVNEPAEKMNDSARRDCARARRRCIRSSRRR